MLQQAWQDEGKTNPRLSLAFALVMLGKTEVSEFSPLTYLINNLDSASYKGVAFPFLVELARDPAVRTALYRPLETGTKDEKIGIAGVLARSGDKESLTELREAAATIRTPTCRKRSCAPCGRCRPGWADRGIERGGWKPPHEDYLAFFCFCWPTRTLKCSTLASWNAL